MFLKISTTAIFLFSPEALKASRPITGIGIRFFEILSIWYTN